jgi:hypothetical protein
MWPIQLAFHLLISCRIFLCSWTPSNALSFLTWSVQLFFSILLQHLLQRVIEGKVKGGIKLSGRRGRRCRKLLDDVKEKKWYSYFKEETLDHTTWRARFGRGVGPVVRQTNKWMNVAHLILQLTVCMLVIFQLISFNISPCNISVWEVHFNALL